MQPINWKQVIVTSALSLIVALVAYYIENPSAQLVYSTDTIQLNSLRGMGSVYRMTVWNDGARTVEDVQLFVQQSQIDKSSINVDASFNYKTATEPTGIKIEIPILNSGERLILSWKTEASGKLPLILLRGKGAIGQVQALATDRQMTMIVALLAGTGTALLLVVVWRYWNRTKTPFPSRDLKGLYVKRPDAHAWLVQKLMQTDGPKNIDAMGVKVDVLYRILKNSVESGPPPHNFTIRVLALAPQSLGAKQREALEGHEKVTGDADQYSRLWPKLVADLQKYPAIKIDVRFFELCPAFYIIRMNKHMLAGTYLSGSGYDGITIIADREDGAVFDQFQGYFDLVWAAYDPNKKDSA